MNVNDGSANQPRLAILQTWWGMIGVGGRDREWTMEEKFARIAEAGFAGIMGRIQPQETAGLWRKLLDKYKFRFGVHTFPATREELRAALGQAADFGVDFVNAHIMDSFVTGEAAETLIRGMIEEADRFRIPFFVETHRGRVTQDAQRTAGYVEAIPELRLTIDLSHYAIAGEMEQFDARALALFDLLLRRTSCIHGRVSSGQQVQIDIGPNGEHPLVPAYEQLWSKCMAYWLEQAGPGDILPVLPELGPPPYSMTSDGSTDRQRELSDRWQQALVFKRLFERAWEAAGGERG
ncbi:MAG: sugar phosphate isomerase/epimerase [Paenibacillaceae bacterium]|nr:sugar phosphate isomerase/epimerase [Paenibacillaceae bacterium]